MAEYFPGAEKRIVDVKWTKKGDVLFLYVTWDISSRDPAAPKGIAKITGLPSVFMSGLGPSGASQGDIFKGPYEKADPDYTDDPEEPPVTITEPLTDKAKKKFLLWTKAPPQFVRAYSSVNHHAVLTLNIGLLKKYVNKAAKEANPEAADITSTTFTVTGIAYQNIEPYSVSGWEIAGWVTDRKDFPIDEYSLWPQWDFTPPPPGPGAPRGTTPDDSKYFFNPTTTVPKVLVTVQFDPAKVIISKIS
jgi:hypothetical protein